MIRSGSFASSVTSIGRILVRDGGGWVVILLRVIRIDRFTRVVEAYQTLIPILHLAGLASDGPWRLNALNCDTY